MPTEGDILNHRYQILRVLSDKGGMGVIYQATDLSFNDTVVIKHSRFTEQFLKQQYPELPPDELRSHAEYLRKAFEREARLVRGLKHHALPSVIDYFTTGDGNQFFVMDFIPGKDFGELLDERLQQSLGPFPLDQVLGWADQLLDALNYLHTRFESPILHRDLKPLNLKLTPDGRIVLLDFGLAKGVTPGMSVVSASIHGYTLNYAPLEQIRGKGTSVRSDLYSLSVTLHHWLTCAIPPSAVDRVTETTSGEPDPLHPLHEINSQIPSVISAVLQRAAAISSNERYATAAEMREALLRANGTEPAPSTVKLPSQTAEPTIIDSTLHTIQSAPPLIREPIAKPEAIQQNRYFKVDLDNTHLTVQPSRRWLGILPLLFFVARAIQYISIAKTPEQILWSCHVSNLMMAAGIFFRIPWLIRISAFWQILGLPPWIIDMFNSGITPISVFTHLGGCAVAMIALWEVRSKRGSWLPSLIYFVILQQITRLLTEPTIYTNVNVAHFGYGGMKDWFAGYWTYWLANTAVTAAVLWLMDWALAKIFPPREK